MRRFNKVKLLSVALVFTLSSFVFADALKDFDAMKLGDAYKKVALADYIKTQQPDKKNGKSILPIKRVTFDAVLMSKPKAGDFKYIYMALKMMKMDPMPVIKHQVFVQAEDGKVIAVYLEENFAKGLEKHINIGTLKIGSSLTFKGYHSYNYKRGPAMVMEGLFNKKKDKLVEEKLDKTQSQLAEKQS